MSRKLRVFASDLTHTYITLASGTFPLGLAYVGSALKQIFGNELDLELFKYPADLDEVLKSRKPDVFLFSSYVWNQNLNLEYAKRVKKCWPETLVVGGGPNISVDPTIRKNFLKTSNFVDFWIMNEGEIPACFLLDTYMELGQDILRLKEADLLSTLTLLPDGSVKEGLMAPRLGLNWEHESLSVQRLATRPLLAGLMTMDDVPSPYTSGIMDKFFDDRLYPLIETNRGCPFACTFCQQGTVYFNKMAFRSLENCKEEFEFVAYNMTKRSPGISRVEIADPNFAMFKRDLEYCDHIRKVQDKYGWPNFIGCSTGKNKPEQILDAVSKLLPDSLVISNSMQSTNPDTLSAIKRSNINLDGYRKVQTEIHKRGLRSMADVILCLPNESKESHFSAVMNLIDSGVQEFTSYQAMILKGTELELQSMHERYGLKTKYRALPRAAGAYYPFGEEAVIPEIERITVETNTLKFADYLAARRLHLITMIYHNAGVFNLVHRYLEKQDVPISKLIQEIYGESEETDWPLRKLFDDFIGETRSELYDTEEEALAFYGKKENLERVKRAEVGGNLLWKYLAVTFFEYWSSAVEVLLKALSKVVTIGEQELLDLTTYFNARIVNISDMTIQQDVLIEIKSSEVMLLLMPESSAIALFSSDESRSFKMSLSDAKYKTLSHAKICYQNNRTGWSMILAVHRVHSVVRDLALL